MTDVNQSIRTREDFRECTEVHHALDLGEIDPPDLRFLGQFLNHGQSLFHRGRIGTKNRYAARIFHIDLRTGGFLNGANHFAPRANDVPNPIGLDEQHFESRCKLVQLCSRQQTSKC